MTTLINFSNPETQTEIVYPSSDGEPVAETYDHLYVLLSTLEVLKQHLNGQQATVLANQFLYYAEGLPHLRVAPDVMVILGVEPGGRDNYKVWQEGQVPQVVFEMTSKGTKAQDNGFKKDLYEQLGVQEYWLFDPKGEWLDPPLQGYGLGDQGYHPLPKLQSDVLHLRLAVEDKLIGFYRLDNGEKLLLPKELAQALKAEVQRRLAAEHQAEQERQRAEQERQRAEQERQRAEQERQRAEQERQRAEQLAAKLAQYQAQFGELPE